VAWLFQHSESYLLKQANGLKKAPIPSLPTAAPPAESLPQENFTFTGSLVRAIDLIFPQGRKYSLLFYAVTISRPW